MNKIFSIVVAAFLFASCQSSTEDEAADSVSADSVTMSVPAADSGSLNAMVGSPAAPATATPATTAPATEGASGSSAAANPEHGKPGHRCDIPVGAPLNSPPGKAPAAASASPTGGAAPTMAPMPAPAPAPVQAGSKGGRINPAHGQPGHDCAVPVGQPLKG